MTLDPRLSTLDSPKRVLLDSGTAYSKLYYLENSNCEVMPSRSLKDCLHGGQGVLDPGSSPTCHSERRLTIRRHSERGLTTKCHSERSEESHPGYGPAPQPMHPDSSPPLLRPWSNLGPRPTPAPTDIGRISRHLTFITATGHNASRYSGRVLNELLALSYGGLELIAEDDFVLVDCGARDIKLVRVEGRRVREMNWNTECGAFCGQTLELLLGHFGLQAEAIPAAARPLAVTCGVLGMTQLFDLIAADVSPEEAVARFVKGIAQNVHRFAGRPERLYLSGGFCDNRLFLESLDCQVVPLGRFVLLEGLRAELARTEPELWRA